MIPSTYATVAQHLRESKSIVVTTGAGMSAESGVPTFRDETGLWMGYRPEEVATPTAFARDPNLVWSFYRKRRADLAPIQPHVGHRVLAGWQQRFEDLTIITQNVDGLHERAGATRVFELHGRLDLTRCTACNHQQQGLDDLGALPTCPNCGALLRPAVVWFEEMLPEAAIVGSSEAIDRCDLLLVIGTSNRVYPAAALVEQAALRGVPIIEINPKPTPLSNLAGVALREPCGRALAGIDAAL